MTPEKNTENENIVDLKETKMDGPTFRALREYFQDWGERDPTLFKTTERHQARDVERKRA